MKKASVYLAIVVGFTFIIMGTLQLTANIFQLANNTKTMTGIILLLFGGFRLGWGYYSWKRMKREEER